ncbi:hypothetical protein EMEDMD4_1010018 [Sinorhizobium medicae]|uniref:Uncharacterized protein n=1 Tax=Sinorhizobium medicae TaxID=110321 RepID=A0A508WU98_9HYPH|nr:hypothetical protein EMEDMD4_1010018 [Sinorhizobium medicae]
MAYYRPDRRTFDRTATTRPAPVSSMSQHRPVAATLNGSGSIAMIAPKCYRHSVYQKLRFRPEAVSGHPRALLPQHLKDHCEIISICRARDTR